VCGAPAAARGFGNGRSDVLRLVFQTQPRSAQNENHWTIKVRGLTPVQRQRIVRQDSLLPSPGYARGSGSTSSPLVI
jgi:hypothetical protein